MVRVESALILLVALLCLSACKKPTPSPDGRAKREASQEEIREKTSTTFQRGRFSIARGDSPDATPTQRTFGALQPDQRAQLSQLIASASNPALPKTEAMKLIDQARDLESVEVLPLIDVLLRHREVEVRGSAISLLDGCNDKAVLPVIDKALGDSSMDVRIQAMEAMARVAVPETSGVLKRAFADTEVSVRQLAFQNALRQDDATRLGLIEQAIQSPAQDLANAALGTLETAPSKNTVTLLMDALSHPDAFIREKAHDSLALTLYEDFKSAAQAKAWWQQNHQRFDNNLVLKNP